MEILTVMLMFLNFHQCKGLTLSVKTGYFEIGGSGLTLECNLDGATWNTADTRIWRVPPSTTAVITNGVPQTGYSEDLSDASTAGIIRMTTPSFGWDIENELFQCDYKFSSDSLNATRDKLARNSGGSASYDESTKKCVFTISEILPSPTTVVTHVQSGSGELDISSDSRVQETLNDNSDQGQTFSYRIEVDGSNMKDGDQVKFQVTAGPFTENKTCDIEKSGLSPGVIAAIVIAVCVVVIAAVVIPVILWKKKLLCFKVPTEEKPTGSTNSGIRSTSPNQVKPSVENSTPMVENSNVTNSKVDTKENSKDPILDIENKKRHTGVEPLTERSEGQPEINQKKPLPSIGQ